MYQYIKTHLPVLLLAGILIGLSGCKHEVDALPTPTQQGRNTLGFLLNGKAWVPDGGGMFTGIPAVEGGYQGDLYDSLRNNVWILASKKDGSGLHIYLRNVGKAGTYQLNQLTQVRPTILVPLNYAYFFDKNGTYLTNDQFTGTVVVTKADTVSGVIAGTFSFTAKDYPSGKVITVTNGRFDVNAATQ